jgi:rhamnulokinase
MKSMEYLAIDLGAGSGRAMVGSLTNDSIRLEEIHRFNNTPVQVDATIYWDFPLLFHHIKQSIRLAVKQGCHLQGMAVDTWGVDFGLLDNKGLLLSNPVSYRDARTQGMWKKIQALVSSAHVYQITGIQQMEINTLVQLFSLKQTHAPLLSEASQLLFMPDLVNYFLTENAYNEYTIASTSQLLNAKTRQWEIPLFEQLGLPAGIMGTLIHPGNIIGKTTAGLSNETGVKGLHVFAVGSHDTASAIAAIPAGGDHWAFLSSGTWSLLGVETDEPILTPEAMNNDFTNEGGVDGKILFMRNCTGLWLLQRLLPEWEAVDGEPVSYDALWQESAHAAAFRSILNTDDTSFTNPASMSEAIKTYCTRTQQPVPQSKGEFVRCILESLALKYHFVMKQLKQCAHKTITELYVVGGGSRNELLNQYTANALGIPVISGFPESTALGNIMQQAVANGQLSGMAESRALIRRAFALKRYAPQDTEKWETAAQKFAYLYA